MRRLLALSLLLLVPLAGAQGVQQVTWSGPSEVPAFTATFCDGSTLEVLDDGSFRFSEGALASGCGEASIGLALPGGTGAVQVLFTADRQVEGTPLGPRDMAQELRFEAGGETAVQAVFPPEAGDRDATDLAFRFDVPAGAQGARITWAFADGGVTAGVGGGSFSASVQAVRLRVEDVAATATTGEVGTYLDGDEVVHVHEGSVVLPVAPDALRFEVVDWEISALRTPSGVLPASELTITEEAGTTIVSLPGQGAGPGTYTLQGATRSDAPAAPIGGIHPAVWVLLGLPLVLGTFSVQGAARFYRQAPVDRRKDGMRLLVQNAAVVAGYVALLATAFLARDRLAASRFTSTTWLLLAQMAAVSVAFLALWQLGSRHMTRRLQADVARVEEEERELRRLNDELQRSNEDLERFARVASHDLKEPLRSVQFHAEKVAAQYAKALDGRGRRSLELAANGARRMRDLVDGISAYSSLEPRMEAPQRFEVRDAAQAVVSSLEALVRERRATVELGSLPPMVGHRGLIEQALQNLVTNALRHGGMGRHVVVRGRRGRGRYVLEVGDDGPGIAPEFHDRIFEVFQRLEGRTEEGGTGMGLAIVKRIVVRHGGTVDAVPRPGRGGEFRFRLPAHEWREPDGAT